MPKIKGIEYGNTCSECDNFEGVIVRGLKNCKLKHVIIFENGCPKCGTPKRKEIVYGEMKACEDWKPSKFVDFDF